MVAMGAEVIVANDLSLIGSVAVLLNRPNYLKVFQLLNK